MPRHSIHDPNSLPDMDYFSLQDLLLFLYCFVTSVDKMPRVSSSTNVYIVFLMQDRGKDKDQKEGEMHMPTHCVTS